MKSKMKKSIFLLTLGIGTCLTLNAQSGNLIPDSSQVKRDTLRGTFVYLDSTDKLQVGRGIIVRELAPMLFKPSAGGNPIKTEQVGLLSEKAYINNRELTEGIIYFKPKK